MNLMASSSKPHGPNPADARTPFERFRDLAQRVLTTPKAELVKPTPAKPKRRKK